jgi:triosephosphate isomerase (TIM)
MALSNKILACNWKMNLKIQEATELARFVSQKADKCNASVWIAPSFTLLPHVAKILENSRVNYGAQNVHWDTCGAYTGEISPSMLKEIGCSFSIVGHSERRQIFGESNDIIIKRALGSLKHGLSVILCVGETLQEFENNETVKVVSFQVKSFLNELANASIELESFSDSKVKSIIIAYEPVWAIGTGKVATNENIASVHTTIHSIIQKYSFPFTVPVLYGGSVNENNARSILDLEVVDGALIGGASIDSRKIGMILDQFS